MAAGERYKKKGGCLAVAGVQVFAPQGHVLT